MKKLITLVLALVFTAGICQAQLLWKISGGNLKQPSYIFGTHHVAPTAVLYSVKGFNDALKSVSEVYGEVDMAFMKDPQALMGIQQKLMAPADSTLSSLLTSAQVDSVVNVLNKYAGGMLTKQHIEPLVPSAIGAQLAMLQNAVAFPSFNPAEQLDHTIQEMALKAGKAVKGLETIDFQMGILYGAPLQKQAMDLMETIRIDDNSILNARKLASAYRLGNLNTIYDLFTDPASGMNDETKDRMINSRNAAWVDFLLAVIPTTSVMVVVGAGHLPGQKGIIELFRRAGYTVEPA